jgi:polyisoprenoid-binding protein YceI
MMKHFLFLLSAMLMTKFLFAQYKPVDQRSQVKFVIKNFGFAVDGSFTGLQGGINFDSSNLTGAAIDVSIDASSVNTGNNMRDDHLKGQSYFGVTTYPRIRLVATKITAEKPGAYLFIGNLTIKDKTKEISFPFTVTPGIGGLNFRGQFTINRKDFGVGGTSTIASELTVLLSITATR